MKNKIKITRETMLKNAIYRSLIGFNDENDITIPCEIRKEIQKCIINEFKTQLRMNHDNSFLNEDTEKRGSKLVCLECNSTDISINFDNRTFKCRNCHNCWAD